MILFSAEKIVKGIAPVMKHQLVDKMVIEGDQQVTLKCQVTGTPEPMITWYFGNRKLPNCSEFEQTYNGLTSIAKLVIGEVFVDDEGEYSCIAENCCGRARSSCWIAVEGRCKIANNLTSYGIVFIDHIG